MRGPWQVKVFFERFGLESLDLQNKFAASAIQLSLAQVFA